MNSGNCHSRLQHSFLAAAAGGESSSGVLFAMTCSESVTQERAQGREGKTSGQEEDQQDRTGHNHSGSGTGLHMTFDTKKEDDLSNSNSPSVIKYTSKKSLAASCENEKNRGKYGSTSACLLDHVLKNAIPQRYTSCKQCCLAGMKNREKK